MVTQEAGGLGRDVGEVECGELGAAQRGGEREQDQRGVAGALGAAVVDPGDDRVDLGHRHWPACRVGAVPRLRRRPWRTWRMASWPVGSTAPARRCSKSIRAAGQAQGAEPGAPCSARSVR